MALRPRIPEAPEPEEVVEAPPAPVEIVPGASEVGQTPPSNVGTHLDPEVQAREGA